MLVFKVLINFNIQALEHGLIVFSWVHKFCVALQHNKTAVGEVMTFISFSICVKLSTGIVIASGIKFHRRAGRNVFNSKGPVLGLELNYSTTTA